MESPVVVGKPPEYHGNAAKPDERGFPFDEEEASGAWSELAARHPDIAARLRQRPATWARKRRPSSQDADDFGDNFGGFDRFPFDDIPPEFREHFPTHWNRRFGPRDEPQPQPQAPQSPPQPQQQTAATQTEQSAGTSQQKAPIPQYGLRNTVDLGQKSPVDPSLVNAEDRNQRSMSAPPEARTANQNLPNKMSGQNHHQEQQHQSQAEQSSNVRHIPIFVEGRDEPVINKSVDHGAHFGETKPTYASPPPQQPHVDREQYFADDGPAFHHPPNFGRTFGTPFNKGFRPGPQPFVQQKVYPQNAFARGASPQRSQSPKPQTHPEEHFKKVPVYHDQPAPKAEPPKQSKPEPPKPQPKQSPQQHQPSPPQQHQPSPPQEDVPQAPKSQQTSANDPISLILHIQTDVLNLMTEVEKFSGSKKDKKYLFLDEMLTRNLIKLDNIETDGKENIRQARKEAIRCIQKCIAVLETKADKGNSAPQPTQDIDMNENSQQNEQSAGEKEATENGEVEMKEDTKEAEKVEPKVEQQQQVPQPADNQEEKKEEQKSQTAEKNEVEQAQQENKETVQENKETAQPADTRPEGNSAPEQKIENKQEDQNNQESAEKKPSPKKGTKVVKKRDKSKDKKEAPTDSNKEKVEEKKEKLEDKKMETMQVDDKGDKTETQAMEVDSASASQ